MRSLSGAVLLYGLACLSGFAMAEEAAAPKAIDVKDDTFRCIQDMTKVRHFFVDNLLGDLDATVKVANSTTGGVYPTGTVLQLLPSEVMIKQPPGFSPVTKDWEFFEIDVSPEGSKIRTRGFVDVNNRFGGNCFGCHVAAKPEFDFVCELDHGCAPIPVTRAMITALQNTDPRCKNAPPPSAADLEALKALQALSAPPPPAEAPKQ
jgi:hypothetical protein